MAAKKSIIHPLGVLFRALINMAIRPQYLGEGNSNPCSHFIEDGMTQGGLAHWVNYFSEGKGGEYRLNGAGLKMYVTISHTGMRAMVSFGGDQADLYPEFVAEARAVAAKLGLDHESYFKGVA